MVYLIISLNVFLIQGQCWHPGCAAIWRAASGGCGIPAPGSMDRRDV